MTYIIPLPGYKSPPLGQNIRKHWAAERKIKQDLAGVVLQWARVIKLPTGRQQVRIVLHWEPAVELPRDTDNWYDTVKPCVDALVRYGLVRDDDHRIVDTDVVIHDKAAMPRLHYVGSLRRQPARIWLEVEDLSPSVLGAGRPDNPPDSAA